MEKIVRIGGAGGFLGDSSVAAPQLLKGGKLAVSDPAGAAAALGLVHDEPVVFMPYY